MTVETAAGIPAETWLLAKCESAEQIRLLYVEAVPTRFKKKKRKAELDEDLSSAASLPEWPHGWDWVSHSRQTEAAHRFPPWVQLAIPCCFPRGVNRELHQGWSNQD